MVIVMICNKCFIKKDCPCKDIIEKCCNQCSDANNNEFIDACIRFNKRHNNKLKVNLKLKREYACFNNNDVNS